jgi:hypothetical protein
MSGIAARATRDEKEKWLLRPINWAGETALIVSALCFFMMFDRHVSWPAIAISAIGGLLVVSGLTLWGIRRIMNATRGRS